ncbi:DegV domain-containing protein [Bacillus coahuilensis p1.1.43]|uniref:DegV domain-containing protein n=1 Tax=Bacillus coahuilensis p1.1.43 TaxID=1150625 RepID=A0A147K8K9_9BACI|nr:DegV family protein [Bacillus coahuilensis]KUP06488.1 DegV domain-containing protein [Bacillus coahuilensis p1.1.43]
MTKIKIVTDSTADLTQKEIESYQLNVVPLSISINGENYLDGQDITPEEFMTVMANSNELPKSSQPPAGTFLELYDELGKDGSIILSIHMTGNMSGTVRSAESAAEMSKSKVFVVDSKFISRGLAFQVLEAAKMAHNNQRIEEILTRLNEVQESTRLFVVVNTLDNLVKGGRIGKGKALIGSLLNIKPIADLSGGEYTPVANVRSHSQVVKFLVKEMLKDTANKTIKYVGLSEADGMELAQRLKEQVSKQTGFSDFHIGATTPIVSTHTGPGAIGFMYMAE